MDEFEEDYIECSEPFDIDKTMAQLTEAWKCVPDMSLTDFLDEIIIRDMSPDEVCEVLDDFILQNQQNGN